MKEGAEGVLAELLLSYPDAVRVHVYKLFEIPVAASVCVRVFHALQSQYMCNGSLLYRPNMAIASPGWRHKRYNVLIVDMAPSVGHMAVVKVHKGSVAHAR